MPSAKLVEKRKEFEAKQDALHKILEEAGPELDMDKDTSLEGDSKAKAEAINRKNTELEDLGKEIDDLVALDGASAATKKRQAAMEAMGGVAFPDTKKQDFEPQMIGDLFVKSEAFTGFKGGKQGPVAMLENVDLKTLFQTAAGWAPETIRTGKVVDFATRPIQIIDLIPPGTTNQTAIVYMEETTFTNAAAEVDEAGAKPEAALALTERSSSVRKIAVWIPVTSEQLEDVEGVRTYLNNRLGFMLRQRLDSQLLVGNGVAPNLAGILNVAGIQTFVRAGDRFDALYDAIKRVRVTGRAIPNVIIMHPNDFQEVRLTRTDDGLYVLGNPDQVGPTRIWGLPVVESDAETEHTALVGDFPNFCQLFEKKGIDIQITDSHDNYFIYNKLVIRAEIRVAFPVYRPAAFCAVTAM